jgi:phage regulator Rha-like protein
MPKIMNELSQIESKLILVREQKILLDRDVAELYGIETKRINEAYRNNPEKFPEGYVLFLDENESKSLRSKFSTLNNSTRGKHTKYQTKAFTEKGLYMLATILRSERATETTLAIIETYAKLKEFTQLIQSSVVDHKGELTNEVIEKSSGLLKELIVPDLKTDETETSFEINFAVMKLKHTIKRKK